MFNSKLKKRIQILEKALADKELALSTSESLRVAKQRDYSMLKTAALLDAEYSQRDIEMYRRQVKAQVKGHKRKNRLIKRLRAELGESNPRALTEEALHCSKRSRDELAAIQIENQNLRSMLQSRGYDIVSGEKLDGYERRHQADQDEIARLSGELESLEDIAAKRDEVVSVMRANSALEAELQKLKTERYYLREGYKAMGVERVGMIDVGGEGFTGLVFKRDCRGRPLFILPDGGASYTGNVARLIKMLRERKDRVKALEEQLSDDQSEQLAAANRRISALKGVITKLKRGKQ